MKHYDIEINKEMVLSTCHVTEKEVNNLPDNVNNYSSDHFNVRLHVVMAIEELEECEEIEDYQNLYHLLHIAKSHNCKWLVLDCDGPEVEGLPIIGWGDCD